MFINLECLILNIINSKLSGFQIQRYMKLDNNYFFADTTLKFEYFIFIIYKSLQFYSKHIIFLQYYI